MALYRPDIQLERGRTALEELNNEDVKYYVDHLQNTIEKQREELKEYKEFFQKLDKFLPNKNVIYGARR